MSDEKPPPEFMSALAALAFTVLPTVFLLGLFTVVRLAPGCPRVLRGRRHRGRATRQN
jgi:hypothetical protein